MADAGTATGAPPSNQHGLPHVGAVDIGAYELRDDAPIFADGFVGL